MRCAAATIPGRCTRPKSLAHGAPAGFVAVMWFALLGVLPAAAGPWAREDGTAFLSIMLSAEEPRASIIAGEFDADPTASLYGELGLGRGMTAGLELDWGTSSQMGAVFARYTVTAPTAPVQFAVDGGFARRSVDDQPGQTLFRLGASLGGSFGASDSPPMGLPALGRGGWVTLEGAAFVGDDGSLSIWRAEATVGLHVSDRLRAIFALKAEEWPQSPLSVTARPALVLSIAESTSLQAGLVAGLSGSDTIGVSLALWQDF